MRLPEIFAVVAVLAAVAWWLTASAARLDRLHHKVESAAAALDAQVARRAAAALELATVGGPTGPVPGRDRQRLAAAATAALDVRPRPDPHPAAGPEAGPDAAAGPAVVGTFATRGSPEQQAAFEAAQSALTRELGNVFPTSATVAAWVRDAGTPVGEEALETLRQACLRAQLARRFHNDAVAAAQRFRRRRVVRWARLAGHAPGPRMLEWDDALPPGLAAPSDVG